MAEHKSAVFCSLNRRDFKERVAWIAALNKQSLRGHTFDGGTLTLTYVRDALPQVEEMVERERECCAFLEFHLHAHDETATLTISVPDHVKDSADLLLEPFYSDPPIVDASSCCGSCR